MTIDLKVKVTINLVLAKYYIFAFLYLPPAVVEYVLFHVFHYEWIMLLCENKHDVVYLNADEVVFRGRLIADETCQLGEQWR